MRQHRFVVFARHLRGFDELDDAKQFALVNFPAVICERVTSSDGRRQLRELLRHDWLYDPERDEWRIMLAAVVRPRPDIPAGS
ncbi:MAG: hypothetical protein HY744_11205 [Deltaproteobacteria bacterium]|nr:hypothetical protein [Deltaproteobacteria bacterium]